MGLQIIILILAIIITGLLVWMSASKYFQSQVEALRAENMFLKSQVGLNDNIVNEVKVEFSKIAQESLKNQQEALLSEHANDLKMRMELFKAEELTPVNRLLNEFKESIDNYQKSHQSESIEIKNAISTAEKYARALTMNQNLKGEFGEDWMEQIFKFANLEENVHYTKQFVTKSANLKDDELHTVRPDVVINLPNERHLIIDSKVTLTSYLDYIEDNSKLTAFKSEVKKRIIDLSNKNYQNAGDLSQPDFVLMYMPVESSVNLLYEDSDLINQAYKSNIIIVGTSSLLTTIRLVNQLLAQQKQSESVNRIVEAGSNLYETFVQFCEDLIDVQKRMDDVSSKLTTTINRFKRGNRNKPSLFSQVNALKEFGINSVKEIPAGLLEEEVTVND